MQKCRYCYLEKRLDEFPLRDASKGTRQFKCKECQRAYSKRWHKANREKDPTYFIRRNKRKVTQNKRFIEGYKSSTPCTDCGKKYPHYVMDFDHLRDKVDNVGHMVRTQSLQKILAEIAKCELVCSNCHRQRTWQRLAV